MSRRKSEKFFVYAAKKSGIYKGKRLLGVNHSYEGGLDSSTLQDLIDFLKEKRIDPSTVEIPNGFITVAKI
jgi:hypothetical protein